MSERFLTREKLVLTAVLVGGLGAVGLSGCTAPEASDISDKSPRERYSYDYLSGNISGFNNESTSHCLYDTPFSTYAEQTTTIYNSETDIMTITTANGQVLQFTEFDQGEHTIVPVDGQSQQIFETYGCEVKEYEDVSASE